MSLDRSGKGAWIAVQVPPISVLLVDGHSVTKEHLLLVLDLASAKSAAYPSG